MTTQHAGKTMSDDIMTALIKPRHTAEVFFWGGKSLVTEINGEPSEIFDYYLGKIFNVGNGDLDNMQMACGEKERRELKRRQRLGIATGERLNTIKRKD